MPLTKIKTTKFVRSNKYWRCSSDKGYKTRQICDVINECGAVSSELACFSTDDTKFCPSLQLQHLTPGGDASHDIATS